MTLIHKIIEVIKESDHEVVLELQSALDTHPADTDEYYVRLVKEWMDELQEMYDKAEKVDGLDTSLRRIDSYLEDMDGCMEDIRRCIDVVDI